MLLLLKIRLDKRFLKYTHSGYGNFLVGQLCKFKGNFRASLRQSACQWIFIEGISNRYFKTGIVELSMLFIKFKKLIQNS